MTEPSIPAESHDELAVLQAFLERLQAGSATEGEAWRHDHPRLGSAFACLEALESMAPPCASDAATVELGSHDEPAKRPRLPATRFGDYELLEEIGRGGMGVVYKARQISLDRLVAVKMILANHLASEEQIERFHVEARATAAVRHPHIVDLHQAGCIDGQHFLAMHYIDGPSLAQRIARGRVPQDEAVPLVACIARAVDHLHRNRIVHRDLKPSNILLDSDGTPYVTDFGLVKMFRRGAEHTRTGVIVGTPSYMAPEQAAARREEVGPASDVYSLGVILYELLTGQPPFREDNPLDTLMQVLEREPTPPRRLNRRIPRDLEHICLKCLEKSPTARYVSAAALADDLERFLRGESIEAVAPNLAHRLGRWALREPALASRLGVLATFYGVELINYHLRVVPAEFHFQVTVFLGLWAAASLAFQQVLNHERLDGRLARWANAARFAWAAVDVFLFSLILQAADGVASPLVVGYPLLIVGAGLWFRVRMVSFVTALSVLSYAALVLNFYVLRSDLQRRFDRAYDRPVFFVIMLLVLGLAVGYQVNRVRKLTRFYEQRRGA